VILHLSSSYFFLLHFIPHNKLQQQLLNPNPTIIPQNEKKTKTTIMFKYKMFGHKLKNVFITLLLLFTITTTTTTLASVLLPEGFDTVGHVGYEQAIRLKTAQVIPDGATLHSAISIVPPIIAVNGSGSPKILSVSAPSVTDASYGVGHELFIEVKFTSKVVVVGTPSLTMEVSVGKFVLFGDVN
tara:strand:- start:889 stop:1443 length:555 start_codon:yes stop_codon:yes gene_type:complete